MNFRVALPHTGFRPVPSSAGICLKPQHIPDILEQESAAGWFEVHPENYLMEGGPMLKGLAAIRERYPLSFHSVGMSLGSADGVDPAHILKLKSLSERFQPALISDHLSWSRIAGASLNDLLPLPYTEAALQFFCNNINRVQELLGRTIAIENPSTSVEIAQRDMDECDFLIEASRRTGAGILLDINNIFVSARNHGWSAETYLHRIPGHQVSEFHLAGHTVETTRTGELFIDDHGSAVCTDVWELYEQALMHIGKRPTLIEWDTRVPEFSVLQAEAMKAELRLNPDHVYPSTRILV